MLFETSPVKLRGKESVPDTGTFNGWALTKGEDGYKAQREDRTQWSVKILRAQLGVDGLPGPFVEIEEVLVGGAVHKEEIRFNKDTKNVFWPDRNLRYNTPGERMARNRFWQEHVDADVGDGASYAYRLAVTDGERIAYCYRSMPIQTGLNRYEYKRSYKFGPASPAVNLIPADPSAMSDFKSRLMASFAPPTEITARDNPSDSGGAILIEWLPSADDLDVEIRSAEQKRTHPNPVTSYRIFRAETRNGSAGDYILIGSKSAGLDKNEREAQRFETIKKKNYIDDGAGRMRRDPETGEKYVPQYSYLVTASDGVLLSLGQPSTPAGARTQWFDFDKLYFFIVAFIISAAIIWFIQHIKAGKKLFIRKIAGLEAVDEAIGRATEMGRPILFIPGIMDMNDVQTVSAVIILGRIAKTIAEYDTKLMVPTSKSLVMTTGRETVKEAYLAAGRPDAYNDDIVTYLTDEQFGYVAGVNGIMVREKPATCLFLGAFFAESLILAETGNSIGAIQIAGTAMPSQLPFFIAACDYTLIGEELFAASAYLSNDPHQLGSLKGQDVGKLIAIIAILSGAVLATVAQLSSSVTMQKIFAFFENMFSAI